MYQVLICTNNDEWLSVLPATVFYSCHTSHLIIIIIIIACIVIIMIYLVLLVLVSLLLLLLVLVFFFSIIETMLYISWKSLINQNLKTHFKMWHGNTVASTQASVTKSTTYLPISAGYLWTSEADVTPTCCIVTTSKLTKKAKENKMDKIHLASEVFKKQLFKLEL